MAHLSDASASEFPQFPKLPPEIRLCIWSFADSEPHIVRIEKKQNLLSMTQPRCAAYYTIPPLLHVCQESRDLALKRYKPSFSDQLKHPVFFDERMDVLEFGEDVHTAFSPPDEKPDSVISTVRFLVLPSSTFCDFLEIFQLVNFTNLETIYIRRQQQCDEIIISLFLEFVSSRWRNWSEQWYRDLSDDEIQEELEASPIGSSRPDNRHICVSSTNDQTGQQYHITVKTVRNG